MDRLMVVWFFLNMFSFTTAYADYQGDALIELKKVLHDPNSVLQSWDPTLISPCTWFHISCNGKDVIRVDLGNAGLSGTLVPELGNLDKLQYLEIFSNKISGHIPKELGKLSNLVSLELYGNKLTGPIPPELGNLNATTLQSLRLNNNNLCGRIPVHELARLIYTAVDLTNNPRLCTAYTDPPCPKRIICT